MKYVISACLLIVLSSCKVSVQNDSLSQAPDDEFEYQCQRELNELCANWVIEFDDSIEKEYQVLLTGLPQYKECFEKEKKAWAKYQEAVHTVAACEDRGSSTPMYINDAVRQGIDLRSNSLRGLLLTMQGEQITTSGTIFTRAMISDAYLAFEDAVSRDEWIENKEDYRNSLRKEQKCWNEWMLCRSSISFNLPVGLREVYDGCTHMMMRTKLWQLKNQNRCLGMVSSDVIDCALPSDCSDKALLEYPGFDEMWRQMY